MPYRASVSLVCVGKYICGAQMIAEVIWILHQLKKAEGICRDEANEVQCIDLARPRACVLVCIVSMPMTQSPFRELIVRGAATKRGPGGVANEAHKA
jgi:hypothetical protein